jgi:hypothetical protein
MTDLMPPLDGQEQRIAMNAERATRGEPHYPVGALKLGCGGCRQGDSSLLGEVVYCAVCPVTRRRHRTTAKAAGESTYEWQGVEHAV